MHVPTAVIVTGSQCLAPVSLLQQFPRKKNYSKDGIFFKEVSAVTFSQTVGAMKTEAIGFICGGKWSSDFERNLRISLLPVQRSQICPEQMKMPQNQGLGSSGQFSLVGGQASSTPGSIAHLWGWPDLGEIQLKARFFPSPSSDTHLFLQTAALLCFQHVHKPSIAVLPLSMITDLHPVRQLVPAPPF